MSFFIVSLMVVALLDQALKVVARQRTVSGGPGYVYRENPRGRWAASLPR